MVIRKGKPIEELQKLIRETQADKVYFNHGYTPYSRERDQKAKQELDAEVESFKDLVMFEKEEITTNKGSPYKVYTYFAKKWFKKEKPRPREIKNYQTPQLESREITPLQELGYTQPDYMNYQWEAGRQKAEEKLENFLEEDIWHYHDRRDLASRDATSRLSPYIKFGNISIRELYWRSERIKARNPDKDTEGIKTWQEELAWRDFYQQVLWNHPRTTEKPFLEQYQEIQWRSKEEAQQDWQRFTEGRTGYPFVDAGMRQLRETGWMHNRLRMVVTSFACKDLWLDWRDLHDYFSRMFVDADIAAMVGGIQWAYSIGTDAQPYFRVFNPTSQSKDYDPDGEYIRQFIPELREYPDQYIHEPWKAPQTVQQSTQTIIGQDYPEPIVDHDTKRKEAINKFEQVRENQE